jgi:hypothetical protein
MPGQIPGLPGFAAFVGVKFGGYILAGLALKKVEPTITAGVLRIATTRTIFGVILGPIVTIASLPLVDRLSHNRLPGYTPYILLGMLRILVWALVISLLPRKLEISAGRLWTLALAGAVWSCLLDIPGYYLAVLSPGKFSIC